MYYYIYASHHKLVNEAGQNGRWFSIARVSMKIHHLSGRGRGNAASWVGVEHASPVSFSKDT